MQEFLYIGQSGQDRVSGILSSGSLEKATRELKLAGTSIISIRRIKKYSTKLFWEFLVRLAMFVRQGYNVTDALSLLMDDDDIKIKDISTVILRRLEIGVGLVEGLRKSFPSLTPEILAVIQAGENAGELENACELLLKKHDSELRRQRQMRIVLAYPSVVLVATFIVAWILFDVVLPGLQTAFPNQVELPPISQFILSLSGRFGALVEFIIWALLLVLFPIALLRRHTGIKRWLDMVLIKFPVSRYFIISSARSQFFEILALGLESRLPLPRALVLASAALGNEALSEFYKKALEQIQHGIPLSLALKETRLLNRRELSQLRAAEKSSHLERVVTLIAAEIEEKRHYSATIISQITGPVFVIIIGLIVFIVAMAVVIPMISMQTQFESLVQ
ncbi:type II secretion system F family protein [Alphaproteobacteria bacterium LSUCC0684]